MSRDFVVYRPYAGEHGALMLYPHKAHLAHRVHRGGRPVPETVYVHVGRRMEWSEVYAGHCQWVADQLAGRHRAIQATRARIQAKREQRGAA